MQSKEGLDALFLYAPEGILLVNEEGEIVKINPKAEKMFGYEEGELLGKRVEILIPARFIGAHESYRKEYTQNPYPRSMGEGKELFGLRKDGKQFPVEISLSPFTKPEGTYVIVFIIDAALLRRSKELEKVQSALLEANAKMTALTESTNDTALIVDKDYKVTHFNSAYKKRIKKLYDYDVKTNDTLETIYGKDKEKALDLMRRGLAGEQFLSANQFGEKNTGYFESSQSPIFNEKKEVVGVAVISRDITEIKRIEEELKLTNAKLNALIESTSDLILAVDKEMKFMVFNSAYRELIERCYDVTIQVGDNYYDHFHTKTSPHEDSLSKNLRRCLAGEQFIHTDSYGTDPKTFFEINYSPIYDDDGTVIGAAIFARDITEVNIREEELKLTNAKLNALIESTSDSIFAVDRDLKYIVLNVAYKKLAMELFKVDIALGDKFFSHSSPNAYGREGALNNIQRCFSGEQFSVIAPFPNEVFFEISHNPIYDYDTDTIIGVAVILHDMTEKMRTEQELIRARNEAINTARYKSEFLSNMSHEIRTPMNGIVGITNLLLEKKLDAETKEYLQTVKYSADNLMVIINDILDFSKIEAGKITIEHIDFNLKEHLDAIKKTFQERVKEKGLSMVVKVDDDLPAYLNGDPYRLNQVLVNLIGNAIKFTSKGSVTLKVSKVKEGRSGITIRFDIEDTGIGIPKNKQKMIFESFTQAYTDTTRQYGGTGLGLAITKNLVSLQGGKIKLTSKEQEGSVFSVEIPYKKSKAVEEQKNLPGSNKKKSLRGLRILIVEDNAVNQFLIKQIIAKWEALCTIANNGKEGIDLLTTQDFDIVLMDLQMPELSGYEATDIIRNEKTVRNPGIPIIALTADAYAETKQKVLETGMNDFIPKPFDKDELYGKIIKLCR